MYAKHHLPVLLLVILSIIPLMSRADNANEDHNVQATAEGMSHTDTQTEPELEVVLTPWWDMSFGVGELLSIDCGFRTGKLPYSIVWLNPKNEEIAVLDSSQVEKPTDGLYAVLPLSKKLGVEDSGPYTCKITVNKNENDVLTKNMTVNVQIISTEFISGFEVETLQDWSHDTEQNIRWALESDGEKESGTHSLRPPYDHTYGPSKHTGHFLDVDVKHANLPNIKDAVDGLVAKIYTSQQEKTETKKCIHFWYSIKGQDAGNLSVLLQSDVEEKLLNVTEKSSGVWSHANATVIPQTSPFTIGFGATLCLDTCEEGNIAIDDVRITNGPCSKMNPTPSDTLKIRLVGGSSEREGRLEILHDGEYGTVNNISLTQIEANVICASLYFSTDAAKILDGSKENFGTAPENQKIWLNQLNCTGDKKTLADCILPDSVWRQCDECTHTDDVIISCGSPAPTDKPADTVNSTSILPSTVTAATTSTTTTPTSTTSTTTSTTTTTTATASVTPTKTHTSIPTSTPKNIPESKTPSTLTFTPASTTPGATVKPSKSSKHVNEHKGKKIGRGLVVGIVIIVLIAFAVFGFIIYKGRKRRLRKSKYLNFGGSSYSTEHLPTNEFHLESPLTMSSMGYTVLA